MDTLLGKINKLTNWQAALIIAVLGFAVFFTGLTAPFQGDDITQIVQNPVVHSLSHIRLFFSGGTFYNGGGVNTPLTGIYYRPLLTTMFSFLYTLFGARSLYFHLFQFMLCIANAALLYLVFRYSFKPLFALILALAYLLHPLNSQVVYAIPSMQDALYFFFGILAIWVLLRLRSMSSLVVVGLCLFLSLMSKEAGLCFVVMALVYLYWWDRKRLAPFTALMVLLIALWLILRAHAVGLNTPSHIAPINNLGLVGRLMTAPSIMQFYLTKLVFPWDLAPAYYWVYPHFSIKHVLVPLIIDVAAIALVVYGAIFIHHRTTKAQYYTYLFFAGWAGLGLASTLQIISLDMTACETWFYFSMAGVLGMIGVFLRAFEKRLNLKWFVAICVVVIGLMGTRTAVRGLDWSHGQNTIYKPVTAQGASYIAYNDLAQQLLDQGEYPKAEKYAAASIAIYPTAINYNSLGQAYAGLGEYAKASRAYTAGIRYDKLSVLYENMAALTPVYGSTSANADILAQAIAEFPHDAQIWLYSAISMYRQGNVQDANQAISRAYSYDPSNATIAQVYSLIKQGSQLNFRYSTVPNQNAANE